MRFFTVLFVVLALVGCGGQKLHQDPVWPVPFDAEYPTAEVQACGVLHDLGHALCSIERGQPYDQVKFGVYVYYKGTVKVASRDCGLDEEYTYDQTGVLPISIPGNATKSCNITVTVQPKFPNEESSGIKIYSLKGMLFIRVVEKTNKNWKGFAEKVSGQNFSATINMWVGKQDTDVEMNVAGCGSSLKKVLKPVDGYVELELEEALPADMGLRTCTLEGYVRSKVFKDLLFNILVSKYDERTVPLPIPVAKIDGKKITITGDSAVSVVALNEKYEIDNTAKFDWDATKTNTVRLLTTSGRSVVGTWLPGKGWTWKN